MRPSRLAWLNVAVKATLGALIAFYLLRRDLPQFQGKIMPVRAVAFPLVAALVPIVWWLRGRPRPYPHLPDALIVLPAIVDFGGNAADMYRFEWFDHSVHFTNLVLLTIAGALLVAPLRLGRAVTVALIVGAGAVIHTMWEIFEHWIDHLLDANLDVTARTTINDLTVGLVGAALGAAIGALLGERRPELGSRLVRAGADP